MCRFVVVVAAGWSVGGENVLGLGVAANDYSDDIEEETSSWGDGSARMSPLSRLLSLS